MKKKTIVKNAIIVIIVSIICKVLIKIGESLGIEKMKKFYTKRIEELKDEHDKEVDQICDVHRKSTDSIIREYKQCMEDRLKIHDSIHKEEMETLKKGYEELNEKYKRCLDRESDMVNNALEEIHGLLDFPQRPDDYYKKIIEK